MEFHQVFLEPGVPGRYLDGRYRLGIHESWIEIESEGMGLDTQRACTDLEKRSGFRIQCWKMTEFKA